MVKILIAGAGGAPSEGVINSLLLSKKKEEIIWMGSEPSDLVLSNAKRKYYVPYANTPIYKENLLKILKKEQPDLIHFQNDLEVYHASLLREEIHKTGCKTFMPEHDVIDICVNKWKSYQAFKKSDIKVPTNILINNEEDLIASIKKADPTKPCLFEVFSDINSEAYPKTYFGEEMYNQKPYIPEEIMKKVLS